MRYRNLHHWKGLFFNFTVFAFGTLVVAALAGTVDLRPWLSPQLLDWQIVTLTAVGTLVAYLFTKLGWRQIDHRRHANAYELRMRAAAYTSTTWNRLLAIGHAMTAMLALGFCIGRFGAGGRYTMTS